MNALAETLERLGPVVIAVSGGVDSLTLAAFAHRLAPERTTMVHAVSPAVPPSATRRVEALAIEEGWQLSLTGTGEFEDERYRLNPVDRCYFCKTNLYDRLRAMTPAVIASGANLDDLGDYRPGLLAAEERQVVHPYILARMNKSDVRAIARELGLADIAELPAQPCLASRVETGIAIDADDLAFVDHVERSLAVDLPTGADLRCRITRGGVVIEVDIEQVQDTSAFQVKAQALVDAGGRHYAGLGPYRRGAMFVHHG